MKHNKEQHDDRYKHANIIEDDTDSVSERIPSLDILCEQVKRLVSDYIELK